MSYLVRRLGKEVYVCAKLLQSCQTVYDPVDYSPPGKNSRVGFHALLKGIFLTQGLNTGPLCPLHCRRFFTPNTTWETLGKEVGHYETESRNKVLSKHTYV